MRDRDELVALLDHATALDLLLLESIRKLAERGVDPPIWRSANSPAGTRRTPRTWRGSRGRIGKR